MELYSCMSPLYYRRQDLLTILITAGLFADQCSRFLSNLCIGYRDVWRYRVGRWRDSISISVLNLPHSFGVLSIIMPISMTRHSVVRTLRCDYRSKERAFPAENPFVTIVALDQDEESFLSGRSNIYIVWIRTI